jgi:hypothetical protein
MCCTLRTTLYASILLGLGCAHATAQTGSPMPENTIKCDAFKKQPGGWYVGAPTTFDVGNARSLTLSNTLVGPRFMDAGGADLYQVIEKKCGGSRT